MNDVLSLIFTGIGATVILDVWGVIRKSLLGLPAPDYTMVGRWMGHMAKGTFRHDRIAAASPVAGERVIGWITHYATGVAFAAGLIGIVGFEWLHEPTIVAALVFGLGTVAVPFLLMQPGMGAGIAASRTANPSAARLQSLITHAVFGFGLWAAAELTSF
ncbi:DUF2938 domain-containing protein [Steroidobacter flavus]|uniref:DUF2938 domain-containing protein n=1 Tax=Steroidobacter flavus TaxID=1842136 RepID=A0ABV8SSB7_9GAMM